MTDKFLGIVRVGVLAILVALLAAPLNAVGLRADMLDEITLASGRTLQGDILEESETEITILVKVGGISAKQTFKRSEVLDIRYDAISVAPEATASAKLTPTEGTRPNEIPEDAGHIAYVIPVRGLVGVEAHEGILKRLWAEATEAGADTIIFNFDCHDGFYELEQYRDMIQDFKEEAREKEARLVAWVKDARGVAVSYALMFEEIYFEVGGTMGGGEVLDKMLKDRFTDEQVRAKMISAWVGICRGMAVEGGYDAELCEAMIRPEYTLFLEWEGDRPRFYRTQNPERTRIAVDTDESSEGIGVRLTAESAVEYRIARGVAATLEDLMYQLGQREYYHYEGTSEKVTDSWIDGLESAIRDYEDLRYQIQDINNYPNMDQLRKLGLQKQKLEDIRRLLLTWPPLQQMLVSLEQIELEIDMIKKQIRALNDG